MSYRESTCTCHKAQTDRLAQAETVEAMRSLYQSPWLRDRITASETWTAGHNFVWLAGDNGLNRQAI